MRFLLEAAKKDLLRMRRDPIAISTWVGIPILIGVLMVGLFGRGEVRPRGLLLLADEDDTFVSTLIANAYTQGELGEMITVEKVPLEEGERRIGRGDGSALLVIPEGFADAFLRGDAVSLRLVKNPSQSILPSMIEEITTMLTEAGYYLRRVMGTDLARYADLDEEPPEAQVVETSRRMYRLMQNSGRYLDPLAIEVSAEAIEAEQQIEMGPLMLPSVIYMAVVFLGFGSSSDIWKEKNGGVLRRLLTTPGSVSAFLGGKLIAIGLVLAAVASAGLAVGRWLTGMDIQSFVVAVCWIILTGPVFYLALMIVHVHAGRERAASILTNVIVMTFAMVGGSFFPFEVMPAFLANIGRMTPNGWALEQLKAIMHGEMGAAALAPRVAAVIAAGGLAFWIVARRIRRGFVA